MPYTVDATSHGAVISLAATSREEFVRDLVASLLEAAYGKPTAAAPAAGQVVPIQTAGADEAEILSHLAADTLRAVHETAGTLLAPRWIAFDEQRVTAILPIAEGASTGRRLIARRASLQSPLPELRATLELDAEAAS